MQDLDPSLFQDQDVLERLIALIQGFFEMGGMELGLNFVDEATLRAAQADPDQYNHIMVRLFGLSAQFVTLSEPLQEHVIERIAAAGAR